MWFLTIPAYPLSLLNFIFTKLNMLSIATSQPPLDLMFPQELISLEVSKQLPLGLTVRQF